MPCLKRTATVVDLLNLAQYSTCTKFSSVAVQLYGYYFKVESFFKKKLLNRLNLRIVHVFVALGSDNNTAVVPEGTSRQAPSQHVLYFEAQL